MNLRLRSLAIVTAVVALDRITKIYITAHVSDFDVFPVIPNFFNIIHTENPGAAFGMLSDSPGAWRGILLVGVSVAVMAAIAVMLWRLPRMGGAESNLFSIGLSLVFGGALGNLWDRIVRGTVTDFLQFYFGRYEFPSFNAADSAITIGASLLVIDLLRSRNRHNSTAAGNDAPAAR